MVAVAVFFTPAVTALKVAELWPTGIFTSAGTCRAELSLESITVVSVRAGAFREIEQDFDCAPVRDWVPQERSLSACEFDVATPL